MKNKKAQECFCTCHGGVNILQGHKLTATDSHFEFPCQHCRPDLSLGEQVKEEMCQKCGNIDVNESGALVVKRETCKGDCDQQPADIATEETPMGISQWKNHGKKYGYWDYFKKEEALQKRADEAMKVLEKETPEDWEKGYYSFRFEFTDREGERRFEVSRINDPLPFEMAYKMAEQHASEFPKSKIVWFQDNDFLRNCLREERSRVIDEAVEIAEKASSHTCTDLLEKCKGCLMAEKIIAALKNLKDEL